MEEELYNEQKSSVVYQELLALELRVFWKLGSPRRKWTWSFLWICTLCLVGSFAWSGGSFSTGASGALLHVCSNTWMDVAVLLAWGLLSLSQLPALQNITLGLLLWQVSLNFFTFLKILVQDWNRQHHPKGLGTTEILCKGVDVHGTKGLNCNTSALRVQAQLTQTVSVDIAQLCSPWCYNHKITAFSGVLPCPHNCPGLKKQTSGKKVLCSTPWVGLRLQSAVVRGRVEASALVAAAPPVDTSPGSCWKPELQGQIRPFCEQVGHVCW